MQLNFENSLVVIFSHLLCKLMMKVNLQNLAYTRFWFIEIEIMNV